MNSQKIYELLSKPNLEIRQSRAPVGLLNEGNTCYFSVIIQTLFKNTTFCKAVLSIPDSRLTLPGQSRGLSLLYQLKQLFARLCLLDCKFASPLKLLRVLTERFNLVIGDEQDLGQCYLTITSGLAQGMAQIYGKAKYSHLFEGELKCFILDGRKLVGEQQLLKFTEIIVNIGYKNISHSLFNFFVNTIENSTKTKQLCLLNCPQNLLIRLQRATYSKTLFKPQKDNSYFPVPTTLDLGKYFYDQRATLLELVNKQQNLQAMLVEMNDQSKRLQQFDYCGISIIQQLTFTRQLIADSIGFGTRNNRFETLENYPLPAKQIQLFCIGLNKLSLVEASLKSKIQLTKKRIAAQQQALVYLQAKMPRQDYNLVAAMMHRGSAQSGHYYAYIRENKIWRRYDDQTVKEATQEQVIREASGVQDTNACYLMYQKAEVQQLDPRLYLLSNEQGYGKDDFCQLLESQTRLQILRENQQFYIDFNQQNANLAALKVILQYKNVFEGADRVRRQWPITDSRLTGLSASQNSIILFNSEGKFRRSILCVLEPDLKAAFDRDYIDRQHLLSQLNLHLKQLPDYEKTDYCPAEVQELRTALESAERASRACALMLDGIQSYDYFQALLYAASLMQQIKTIQQINRNIYSFMRELKYRIANQALKTQSDYQRKMAFSFIKRYFRQPLKMVEAVYHSQMERASEDQILQAVAPLRSQSVLDRQRQKQVDSFRLKLKEKMVSLKL